MTAKLPNAAGEAERVKLIERLEFIANQPGDVTQEEITEACDLARIALSTPPPAPVNAEGMPDEPPLVRVLRHAAPSAGGYVYGPLSERDAKEILCHLDAVRAFAQQKVDELAASEQRCRMVAYAADANEKDAIATHAALTRALAQLGEGRRDEREACALVCDKRAAGWERKAVDWAQHKTIYTARCNEAKQTAAAIRARTVPAEESKEPR